MTTLAQFPPPPPLPRQYTTTTPDNREDDPEAWREDALCAQVNGDAWFPEKNKLMAITPRDAKRICQSCPVINECLKHALDHDETQGIWGGLSPKERHRLTRDRRAA